MLHSSKDLSIYVWLYTLHSSIYIYIWLNMLHFIPLCIVPWWLEAKLIWGSHENSALHLRASEKNFCSEGCVSGTRILTERHIACLTWSATYPGREMSGKLEHVVAETHDAKMGLWSQFHLVFWQTLLGFGFPKSLFLRPTDDMGNTSSPSSPEQLHTYHLCLPVRWLESGKPTAQQFVAIPCTSGLHRSESRWLCHVLKCA